MDILDTIFENFNKNTNDISSIKTFCNGISDTEIRKRIQSLLTTMN